MNPEQAVSFVEPQRLGANTWAIGGPYAWLYFVDAPRPVLIDTGMTFMATSLVQQMHSLLAGHALWGILHTHSHFDHLGCTSALLEEFEPECIACHPRMAQVLEKPGAVGLMGTLNESLRASLAPHSKPFQPFTPNCLVENRQVLDLGAGIEVVVHYTPGHTRDSVTYEVKPDHLLVLGEAAGVPVTGLEDIQVEFLTSHEDYTNSIKHIITLAPEFVGIPHNIFTTNRADSERFLQASLQQTGAFVARLRAYAKEAAGDFDTVFERVYAEDYKDGVIGQPEPAYRLNLEAQVRLILRENA